jgi:hypothetical protein
MKQRGVVDQRCCFVMRKLVPHPLFFLSVPLVLKWEGEEGTHARLLCLSSLSLFSFTSLPRPSRGGHALTHSMQEMMYAVSSKA